MTEKNTRSQRSARKIAAIALIALAVISLAVSVFGFIQQNTKQTRDNMLEMRDEAVIHASSKGVVKSIGLTARTMKMEEMDPIQQNSKTRISVDALRVVLDTAEEEARSRAEELFVAGDVPDKAALRGAIDQMADAVAASTGLKEKELAVYDELYIQLMESVVRWRDIVPEKNTGKDEIKETLIRLVPDLGKEENIHLVNTMDGFVKMAKAMAEEEQKQEDEEKKDYVLRIMTDGVTNWQAYDLEMKDDALWSQLKEEVPDLEAYEKDWKKDLVSGLRECVKSQAETGSLPEWTEPAEEEETDTGEIVPDHTYFVNSPELDKEQKEQKAAYEALEVHLRQIIPEMNYLEQDLPYMLPKLWEKSTRSSKKKDQEETNTVSPESQPMEGLVDDSLISALESGSLIRKDDIKELQKLAEENANVAEALEKWYHKIGGKEENFSELKLSNDKLKKTYESVRDGTNHNIEGILSTKSKGFEAEYRAYADNGGEKVVTDGLWTMQLASLAKYLLLTGIAVLLLGLVLIFWKNLTTRFGVPRTIIILFFIYLCLLAEGYQISVGMMLGNVLERMTMYGILVLAMMPGIQCGIGLNMGMTIGCISGLLGIMIALQYNMTGFGAMGVACLCGVVVAFPLGWAYSKLLNRMKGNEMTISTYVGFSFVSLMCIGWMLLPFNNPKIVWLLSGKGLRVTHGLLGSFAHILDNLLSFKILGIRIPTGGLLFLGLCCVLMWIFTRSKTGIAMKAVGSNPRFAEASGISVNRMRTIGTVLSTIIAAVGIVIYSQAFGYAQLYTAPKQLGFIASSAILIGGASVTKAKVSHVLLGVFLFEGVLVFGQQIANSAIAGGGLSEVMRILISNGIILYALTQSGGGRRD